MVKRHAFPIPDAWFGEAAYGRGVMFRVELDPDVVAAAVAGSQESGPGAAERIEHSFARLREGLYQRAQSGDGLLRRMQTVARVAPVVADVVEKIVRRTRPALGQQIGLFVCVIKEAFRRCVLLWKNQVSGDSETRVPLRLHEGVDVVPVIERDAEHERH